jgi:hypothetical protein
MLSEPTPECQSLFRVTGLACVGRVACVKGRVVSNTDHKYNEALARQWFSKVDGRYCYRSGTVYAFGSVPGNPMTYEEFLVALKLGFYFPELSGTREKKSGDEGVILTRELLGRQTNSQGSAIQTP